MPKIKMPNVGGNLKELGKKISGEVGSKTKGAVKGIKGLNTFKKQLGPGRFAMMNWIKRLVASYDKLIYDQPKKKKPTIYRIGNKRFIRKKRLGVRK